MLSVAVVYKLQTIKVMLSVVTPNVVMLSGIMLSVLCGEMESPTQCVQFNKNTALKFFGPFLIVGCTIL